MSLAYDRSSSIPVPKSTAGGGRCLWIGIVGSGTLWDICKGSKVESTGPGGVEEKGVRRWVGLGVSRLGEDFSVSDRLRQEIRV